MNTVNREKLIDKVGRLTFTSLVVEDDDHTRQLLCEILNSQGFNVIEAANGYEAIEAYRHAAYSPELVILDWMLPGLDGVDVCHQIREIDRDISPYIIMVSVRNERGDKILGLNSGVNDYIIKPFDHEELLARLKIGVRTLKLQYRLFLRSRELQDSLNHIKRLEGLLPICAWCKKVKDDHDYWLAVEEYIQARSEAIFSHCICPDCLKKHFGDYEDDKSHNVNNDEVIK